MATLADRILGYLRDHPDGADDGELQLALGVQHHAAVNQACRTLAATGRVARQRIPARRNLVNLLAADVQDLSRETAGAGVAEPLRDTIGDRLPDSGAAILPLSSEEDARRFAYSGETGMTENEVKEALAIALEAAGWKAEIRWGHERGVDIVAHQGPEEMLLEAKGEGSQSAMRVNYFLGALGELLQRMDSPDRDYGLVFPAHRQFVGLICRLPPWVRVRLRLRFYLVRRARTGVFEVGCIPEPAEPEQ